jgi:hypothetical protein
VLPQKIESVYQFLRATLGVVALAAGIDKFLELLADWDLYLAPPIRDLLNGGQGFMYVVGIIEALVGIAILSGKTRVFGYALCAWLVGIAINLVVGGWYDVAVRDLVIAAAAFSLARLAQARAEPIEVPTPTAVSMLAEQRRVERAREVAAERNVART